MKILQPTPISQNDIFEVGSFQFIARDIYLDRAGDETVNPQKSFVTFDIIDPTLTTEQRHDSVMAVVRSAFKPEFLNRLDDTIMFDALSRVDLAAIVDIQVEALARRLSDRRIVLEVEPAAREWLADHGFDPLYGARPLRRLIQTAIGDPLARGILAGEFREGATVRVEVGAQGSDEGLVLTTG